MYNASGSTLASSGTMLAMTGPLDNLGIVTFIGLLLVAIGGILIIIGSNKRHKEVNKEMI